MHEIRSVDAPSQRRLTTVPLMARGRISRLVIDGSGVRAEEWDRLRRRWRSLGGGLFEIAVVSDGRPATGPELAAAGFPRDQWPVSRPGAPTERSEQLG